jgi:hypothetical protein
MPKKTLQELNILLHQHTRGRKLAGGRQGGGWGWEGLFEEDGVGLKL